MRTLKRHFDVVADSGKVLKVLEYQLFTEVSFDGGYHSTFVPHMRELEAEDGDAAVVPLREGVYEVIPRCVPAGGSLEPYEARAVPA